MGSLDFMAGHGMAGLYGGAVFLGCSVIGVRCYWGVIAEWHGRFPLLHFHWGMHGRIRTYCVMRGAWQFLI